MLRWLAPMLLVAGCDDVFGLEPVELTVTGHYLRQYEYNNASHAPVVDVRPYAPDELVLVEARTTSADDRAPVDFGYDDGSFSFVASPQDYRFVVMRADGSSFEVQSSGPQIAVTDTFYVRPDAEPAVVGTSITGTVSPAGGITRMHTSGLWSETVLGNQMFARAWDDLPLLSARANDRIYLTRFEQSADAYVATMFAARDLEMVGGVANPIDGTLTAITQPSCAHIFVARQAELARLVAAYPSFGDLDLSGWQLYASPNSALGPNTLFTLAHAASSCEDCTFNYSTPFSGFRTLLVLGAQRQIAVPTYGIARNAGTATWIAIDDSLTCELHRIDAGFVAIPVDIQLAGTALDSDGMSIARPAGKLAEIAWNADGPADHFVAFLVEIESPGVLRTLRAIYTTEPRARLDTTLLVPGHAYYLQVNAVVGRPNAATGDYVTMTYPFAQGYAMSPVFVIAQ